VLQLFNHLNLSSSAYQYQGDDRITYQVVLPDDFASSLGYIPALGTEPYLPVWISTRYATYGSTSGLYLNVVVITTPFFTANPPGFVTVSGITYALKGFYGEQRGTPLQPNLFTIAGPPGAPGAPGAAGAPGAPGAPGAAGAAGAGFPWVAQSVASGTLSAVNGKLYQGTGAYTLNTTGLAVGASFLIQTSTLGAVTLAGSSTWTTPAGVAVTSLPAVDNLYTCVCTLVFSGSSFVVLAPV
jgi:hypothetical protein